MKYRLDVQWPSRSNEGYCSYKGSTGVRSVWLFTKFLCDGVGKNFCQSSREHFFTLLLVPAVFESFTCTLRITQIQHDCFFLALRRFGRMFDHSFLAGAFLLIFFILIKWRLARAHWFHSSGQDQSTVTQRTETDFGRVFHGELRVRSFPVRFPHSAWTAV